MRKRIIQLALAVFILASLAPNMQGTQLLKIPNLVSHVKVHFGSDWTWKEFKDFVIEHYTKSNLPEDKEHQNLPFKSIQTGVSLIAFYNIIDLSVDSKDVAFPIEEKKILAQIKAPIHRSALIWTPPQLV